jgi:hypothetical protein
MSYRDTTESLRIYRDRIAAELAEARHFSTKVRSLETKLAETEARLQKMERNRSLPLLDGLRIASPCDASWDAMAGNDQVRHCAQCDKNVYNLSAMTRDEAEALLRQREGRICVRMYRRPDGTMLTSDCPVGARRRRRRRTVTVALALAVTGSGAMAAVAFVPGQATMGAARPYQPVAMGLIAAPARPSPPEMGEVAAPMPTLVPQPTTTTSYVMGRMPLRPAKGR